MIGEKNKLIAEFMGAKDVSKMFGHKKGFAYQFDKPIGITMDYDKYSDPYLTKDETQWETSDMEFHTSWDWLMPFILKLKESINNDADLVKLNNALSTCDIAIVYAVAIEILEKIK